MVKLPGNTVNKQIMKSRRMDSCSGEATLPKLFCLSSEKVSSLKGKKNCFPWEGFFSF